MLKKCPHCGQELPQDAFGKNAARRDGLQDRCKKCRQLRYKNPRKGVGRTSLTAEIFWSLVDKTDTCWLWQGCRYPTGYGRIGVLYAHRIAYELVKGPIPSGLCVCHTCDNPPCVNPAHLWIGTHQDNMRDRDAKGRGLKGRKANGLSGERKNDIYTVRRRKFSKLLTDSQILEIRKRYIPGQTTYPALAHEYGVSRELIRDIINRKVWAWMED